MNYLSKKSVFVQLTGLLHVGTKILTENRCLDFRKSSEYMKKREHCILDKDNRTV